MKSNSGHKFNSRFQSIALCTFLVYFISSFCGYLNFILAHFFHKNYFPLRSYLFLFTNDQIVNLNKVVRGIHNFTGDEAKILADIPYKLIDDFFFIVISTALVILFFVGYKIIQSNKISQGEIIKWAVLFSILMALAIPSQSSDLYGYIARGGQQTLFHHNPYIDTVDSIKGYKSNTLFCNFLWANQPTTYGPVFISLTKVIVMLSNNNFFTSFFNFKLFNLTVYLFLILLLLRLNRPRDLYLISWNPLILVHGLWNCHNDLISGALIFLGIYMILESKNKNKYFWGIFSLMVAAGIKYISAFLIPIIVFYVLGKKAKRKVFIDLLLGLCCGALFVLILSVDYLIPFRFQEFVTVDKLTSNINLVHQSLIAAIVTGIKYCCKCSKISCDLDYVSFLLKTLFYSGFLAFYITTLFKKKKDLAYECALILFVFLAFIMAKFHSWYLLNLIVLIPFLKNKIFKHILSALSLTHIYALTFLNQAKIINFLFMTFFPVVFVWLKEKKTKILNLV